MLKFPYLQGATGAYRPRFDLSVIFHQMLFLMQPSQQLLDKSVSHYTAESLFRSIVLEMKMIAVYEPTSFSEYDDYEIVTFPAKDMTSLPHTSEHQTQLSKE